MDIRSLTRLHVCYLITLLAWIITIISAILHTLRALKSQRNLGLLCPETEGNQDMYGIGIRLGIYLQLTVTTIVDVFGSSMYSTALAPTNLWFLFALFVGLLTMLRSREDLAVDSYIIISLGNGITLVLLGGTLKLNPDNIPEGALTAFSRFLIWALWKVASSVYWWYTLDISKKTQGCSTFGWFLVNVSLVGAFRTFHKMFNALEWACLAFLVLSYLLGILLLTFLLWRRINTSHWDPSISKYVIFCDYIFVPIGQLHQIVFGPVSILLDAG